MNSNQNIKMEITISNYAELLDFIKREDITTEQAQEVVCKFLKVVCFPERTKEQLIDSTEKYINLFGKRDKSSRPIFLEQSTEYFNIKDIYKK